MTDDFFPENDGDYMDAKISKIGFVDNVGLEGVVVLKSIDGRELPISAFSGETAQHIALFHEGNKNSIPTIYNLVEEIAVMHDLLLMEIRIYQSNTVLRANLYFQNRNKKMLILRNYRASDAIALAVYYDIPIKLRKNILDEKQDRIDLE